MPALALLTLLLTPGASPAGTLKYDHYCFTLDGKDLYVYSGAFHYFRCPEPLWRDRLEKMRAAGFNAVETYIAWNRHEPVEGQFDLGEVDRFFTLCEELGFYILVRPGPYICAEWDVGGYPLWLPGKRVRLRTNDDNYMLYVERWFDHILPVIRRHLFTRGGRVIMVQIENEYGDGAAYKREAVRRMLRMFEKYQINEVAVNTCWTPCARDNTDPDMAKIIDAPNLYPGWDMHGAEGAIAAVRREESNAPSMVTELQGGWFSTFGGPLSENQPNIGPDQCSTLTRAALKMGCGLTNYYMWFGGTNLGYGGARHITTTYDYYAPLREPGGLWEKYYVTKNLGQWLSLFGSALVRAEPKPGLASVDAAGVDVLEKVNGDQGFVFLREEQNKERRLTLTAADPRTGEQVHMPGTGTMRLGAHEARIVVLNAPLGEWGAIRYSTAEVIGIDHLGERCILMFDGAFDDALEAQVVQRAAGAPATLSCPADQEDHVTTAGGREPTVVVVSARHDRALRTRSVPWRDGSTPLVSDAYLVRRAAWEKGRLAADLELRPGSCRFTLPLFERPGNVLLDGKPCEFEYDDKGGYVRWSVETPPCPFSPPPLAPIVAQKDPLFTIDGTVPANAGSTGDVPCAEDLGIFRNGYLIYQATFRAEQQDTLSLSTYDGDPKLVFVNGKLVPEASSDSASTEFSLADYLRPGDNTLGIAIENAGRPNGGQGMEALKGLRSARIVGAQERQKAKPLETWRVRRSAEPKDDAAEVQPDYDDSQWEQAKVGNGWQAIFEGYAGWAWYRTHVRVEQADLDAGLSTLLARGVDDNCLVYVNGSRAGAHEGWDQPFSLNIRDRLKAGDNLVVLAIWNNNGPGGIYKPIALTTEQAPGTPITTWRFRCGLPGSAAGYATPKLNDRRWTPAPTQAAAPDLFPGVAWYRTSFEMPRLGDWTAPVFLRVKARGEAVLFLNGVMVGRYSERGPQTDFYLPECYLQPGARNSVAIALRGAKAESGLDSLAVLPYEPYCVRRARLVVEAAK